MSHFVFRFQPVLSLKKQLEDNMKNELGKAVRKFEDEKEELKRIESDRQECLTEMEMHASNYIDVGKLKEYNSFLLYLKKNIETQKDSVHRAEGNVKSCRLELVKAVKERETLDKLKEKYRNEYAKVQLAKEQKMNDEIAGYSYNKKLLYKED